MKTKIHNLQNSTEAEIIYNHIYTDKKNGTKRIWNNVIKTKKPYKQPTSYELYIFKYKGVLISP